MKVILKWCFIVMLILFIGGYFLFRNWPLVNTCDRPLADLQINGSWINEEDGGRIMMTNDSFFITNLIDKKSYLGKWEYLSDGFIRFRFNNPSEELRGLLQTIKNDYSLGDNYRNIDVQNGGIEVRLKFDDMDCDMSNAFFYLDSRLYREATFQDFITSDAEE